MFISKAELWVAVTSHFVSSHTYLLSEAEAKEFPTLSQIRRCFRNAEKEALKQASELIVSAHNDLASGKPSMPETLSRETRGNVRANALKASKLLHQAIMYRQELTMTAPAKKKAVDGKTYTGNQIDTVRYIIENMLRFRRGADKADDHFGCEFYEPASRIYSEKLKRASVVPKEAMRAKVG